MTSSRRASATFKLGNIKSKLKLGPYKNTPKMPVGVEIATEVVMAKPRMNYACGGEGGGIGVEPQKSRKLWFVSSFHNT